MSIFRTDTPKYAGQCQASASSADFELGDWLMSLIRTQTPRYNTPDNPGHGNGDGDGDGCVGVRAKKPPCND